MKIDKTLKINQAIGIGIYIIFFLVIIFSIVFTYWQYTFMSNPDYYVFYEDKNSTFNSYMVFILLIRAIVIPIILNISIWAKFNDSVKSFNYENNSDLLFQLIIHNFSIVSSIIFPLMLFITVFFNMQDSGLFSGLSFSIFNLYEFFNVMKYYILIPMCVGIIIFSIILKIKRINDIPNVGFCIVMNVINIIELIFFELIVMLSLLLLSIN